MPTASDPARPVAPATSPCCSLPARRCRRSKRPCASASIPYRAENSSVVYATTEIRHLMLALRAAADPTDELALVAALRTPLYGCSDVELYEWRRRRRPLVDLVASPTTRPRLARALTNPVGDALQHLGSARSPRQPRRPGRPARRARRRTPQRSTSPSTVPTPATCGAGSATSSTRPAPGATPAVTACGAIWHGSTSWPARAATPTRSCPNTTTTPSAS